MRKLKSSMSVGKVYQSKLTTIPYVVTAVFDGFCELKLDKSSSIGMLVSELELKERYKEIANRHKVNYIR